MTTAVITKSDKPQLSVVRSHRLVVPLDAAFVREFRDAPELTELAQQLMIDHHAPTEVSVVCLWKRKGGKEGSKERLAKIQLATSGLLGHYCPGAVALWVAADHLRALHPDKLQAIVPALLYAELARIDVDEALNPILKPHDVRAMLSEIAAFGLWRADLEAAADAFRQASYFG